MTALSFSHEHWGHNSAPHACALTHWLLIGYTLMPTSYPTNSFDAHFHASRPFQISIEMKITKHFSGWVLSWQLITCNQFFKVLNFFKCKDNVYTHFHTTALMGVRSPMSLVLCILKSCEFLVNSVHLLQIEASMTKGESCTYLCI